MFNIDVLCDLAKVLGADERPVYAKICHDTIAEIERLQAIINQAGVTERKKNRDVLQALGQMSGNPDEHHIPSVTLAQRVRKAEDKIQELQAIIDKNAKAADLLDRTLTALLKQLDVPLDDTEAKGK